MSTPLEDFFAQFASLNIGFTYTENSTAHNNFQRLRRVIQEDNSAALSVSVARVDFNDAMVNQFNFIFGTSSDLESWQNLCSAIDITPIPDDIKECRRVSLLCMEQQR